MNSEFKLMDNALKTIQNSLGKDNPRSEHSQSYAPSHTPSPWNYTGRQEVDGAQSNDIRADNFMMVCTLASGNADIDESNGHLIAAAPLLLEACKNALPDWMPVENEADGHVCCELTNGNVRQLIAAINAAQGNSGSGDLK